MTVSPSAAFVSLRRNRVRNEPTTNKNVNPLFGIQTTRIVAFYYLHILWQRRSRSIDKVDVLREANRLVRCVGRRRVVARRRRLAADRQLRVLRVDRRRRWRRRQIATVARCRRRHGAVLTFARRFKTRSDVIFFFKKKNRTFGTQRQCGVLTKKKKEREKKKASKKQISALKIKN